MLADPPVARRQTVTDTYHGVTVQEDYRWLEDWDDPAVKAWSAGQNEHARDWLKKCPGVDRLRTRVTEILADESSSYWELAFRGERLFAMKRQPPKQQSFIVRCDAYDDLSSERILVDPNVIDPKGKTTIDWYRVSPDGQRIAVSLSSGGSEMGTLYIYDTSSGEQIEQPIPNVNSGTAGGSLAWSADSSGFHYTRHFKIHPADPDDISVYQHVYYHELGTSPEADRYEFGKGLPQIAEIQLVVDEERSRLLATVQEGDGGKFAHFLRSAAGEWRQFSRFDDGTVQAVFGPTDDLFVVTLKDAPRGKILRVDSRTLDVTTAPTLIPETDDAIVTSGEAFWGERTVVPMDHSIYVVYQTGGPSEIRRFDYTGKPLAAPRQPDVATVHDILPMAGDDLIFGNVSYVEPNGYYYFDANLQSSTKLPIDTNSPVSLRDAVVVREFATSKDGTKIPLNIIMPPGIKLDGNNPCVVYGYGGYGINLSPRFQPLQRIYLDAGIVYVIANLRGGGEFGDAWHRAGNLTNKQNVFDDFAAAVQHVIDRKYTKPERLATMGRSNGGLLMGAVLTQHPELMKAVVAGVGIYDMLRVELSANGAFNVTEFGTVQDEAQFHALLGYSPYHNVRDGIRYPAVLFVTGENDPRVDPMQSRKMTARLQAATASAAPILLRTSANSGHGADLSLDERIDETVDTFAFLFQQLGIDAL